MQKHRVTQFYTAPTAIRALMKYDTAPISEYDLSSLRVLGSVGEPINPEAWKWYYQNIGREKATVVRLVFMIRITIAIAIAISSNVDSYSKLTIVLYILCIYICTYNLNLILIRVCVDNKRWIRIGKQKPELIWPRIYQVELIALLHMMIYICRLYYDSI